MAKASDWSVSLMLGWATFAGTFLTEWTDGAVTCEAFLKDQDSYRQVADKLVQISCCYGFDGWIINIENELSVSRPATAAGLNQSLV